MYKQEVQTKVELKFSWMSVGDTPQHAHKSLIIYLSNHWLTSRIIEQRHQWLEMIKNMDYTGLVQKSH